MGWFPLHLWLPSLPWKFISGQHPGWLRSWRTLQFLWARISTYVLVARTQSCGHTILQGKLRNWVYLYSREERESGVENGSVISAMLCVWLESSCQVSAREGFEYSQSYSKADIWTTVPDIHTAEDLNFKSRLPIGTGFVEQWNHCFGNEIFNFIFLLTLGDLILFFKSLDLKREVAVWPVLNTQEWDKHSKIVDAMTWDIWKYF